MADTDPKKNQSRIQDHPGRWVLGHNQQQGGSELQAGGRALLIQSEITQALSTFRGRMGARTMMAVGMHRGIMNYTAFRPHAMMEVLRRVLMANVATPIVLDPAAGYSPQLIWLAQQAPYARFIELDQPDVIADKISRLGRFSLPGNYQMVAADLNEKTLDAALEGEKADVIVAIGTYISADSYVSYLDYLRQFLSPTGKIISGFPYRPAIEDAKAHSVIFRRFAGELSGTVDSLDDIRHRLDRANYRHLATYRFSELARDLNHPIPADVEVLTVAEPRR